MEKKKPAGRLDTAGSGEKLGGQGVCPGQGRAPGRAAVTVSGAAAAAAGRACGGVASVEEYHAGLEKGRIG